jgi:hypothetical protein
MRFHLNLTAFALEQTFTPSISAVPAGADILPENFTLRRKMGLGTKKPLSLAAARKRFVDGMRLVAEPRPRGAVRQAPKANFAPERSPAPP